MAPNLSRFRKNPKLLHEMKRQRRNELGLNTVPTLLEGTRLILKMTLENAGKDKSYYQDFLKSTPLWEKDYIIVIQNTILDTIQGEIDNQKQRVELANDENVKENEIFGLLLGNYDPQKQIVEFYEFESQDELNKKAGPITSYETSVDMGSKFEKYADSKQEQYSAVSMYHYHPIDQVLPSAGDIGVLNEREWVNLIGVVGCYHNGELGLAGYTPYTIYDFCGRDNLLKNHVEHSDQKPIIPVLVDFGGTLKLLTPKDALKDEQLENIASIIDSH